jgi:membrane protein DedA with SNARE-associated domain
MDWETVREFLERYGYFAIALGTALDQSGMQMFIVGGGALSRNSDRLMILGVMAAGAAGNFLADSIFYGLGRWRADWLKRFVRKPKARKRLKLLRRWMKKHAPPLITFGRFFPWVGRFVPASAGLQKVPVWKEALFSLLGSAIAGVAFGAIGYAAGSSVEAVGKWAGWVSLALIIASIPAGWYLLRRFDQRVERELAQDGDEDAEENPAPGGDRFGSVVLQGAD